MTDRRGAGGVLRIGSARQLDRHAVEKDVGLAVSPSISQPSANAPSTSPRPCSLMLPQRVWLACSNELEIADGDARQSIGLASIETSEAARVRQQARCPRHAHGDVVGRQRHRAIHVGQSLDEKPPAFGGGAALEGLARQEQSSVAAPYQRFGMIGLGRTASRRSASWRGRKPRCRRPCRRTCPRAP